MFLALLIVTSALAGCTGKTVEVDDDLPREPPELPQGSLPLIQFANCTHVVMPYWTSPTLVAAMLPAGFEPYRSIGGLGRLNVFVQDCERTLDNRTVFGPSRSLWTAVFVEPKNQTWGEPEYLDYYVLDYATNVPELVGALAETGIQVSQATIDVEKTSLPAGSQVWGWTAETEDWTATVHHRLRPEDVQPDGASIHLWFGSGPYRLIRANMTSTVDTLLNEGELLWEGKSRFQDAVPGPASAWSGTSEVDATWTLEVDDSVYGD